MKMLYYKSIHLHLYAAWKLQSLDSSQQHIHLRSTETSSNGANSTAHSSVFLTNMAQHQSKNFKIINNYEYN